jgi:hypothetical protein
MTLLEKHTRPFPLTKPVVPCVIFQGHAEKKGRVTAAEEAISNQVC